MAGVPYVTAANLEACTARWLAAVAPWSRSRPLPPLEHAALLVLDVQRYFADPGSHAHLPALDAVLPGILRLTRAFHDAGRPVVLTRHGSTTGDAGSVMRRWWRDDLRRGEARGALVDALTRARPDLVLDKGRYSAFCGTTLHGWLGEHGCDTVVIAGVMTHLCCETTARDAFMRDLTPVVVADGCASQDEQLHVGALRGLAHGFAVITDCAAVAARLGGRPLPVPGPPALPERVDLAVIGAGPAGLAAAIQAARAGVHTCLLDPTGFSGAQARTANWIENYPGFPGGIDGARLMDRFAAQAGEHGLVPLPLRVTAVSRDHTDLCVELDNGHALRARAAIVATGAAPRRLELDLPTDAPVAYRADALGRVRGRRVLVLGGGEAALDQALWLHRRGAASVTVALRGPRPRAMALLVDRATQQGIEQMPCCQLLALRAPQTDADPWRAELSTGATLPVDAVLVCIGKQPGGPRLPGPDATDRLGRTTVPGLYRIGDCCRGRHRQVAIAVGDGVAAAMHATAYLKNETWEDPA